MLSFFDIAALVLVLSAVFGWVNRRFIHLPHQGLTVAPLVRRLAGAEAPAEQSSH